MKQEAGWGRKKTASKEVLEWQRSWQENQSGSVAVRPVTSQGQPLAAGATHMPGAQAWTWLERSPAPWP